MSQDCYLKVIETRVLYPTRDQENDFDHNTDYEPNQNENVLH